ncbi:MAG: hypothetical protein AB7Q04_13995 [Steroidobacteraceae bacterium]
MSQPLDLYTAYPGLCQRAQLFIPYEKVVRVVSAIREAFKAIDRPEPPIRFCKDTKNRWDFWFNLPGYAEVRLLDKHNHDTKHLQPRTEVYLDLAESDCKSDEDEPMPLKQKPTKSLSELLQNYYCKPVVDLIPMLDRARRDEEDREQKDGTFPLRPPRRSDETVILNYDKVEVPLDQYDLALETLRQLAELVGHPPTESTYYSYYYWDELAHMASWGFVDVSITGQGKVGFKYRSQCFDGDLIEASLEETAAVIKEQATMCLADFYSSYFA